MKAVFILDALAFVLPITLMLYTFFVASSTLLGDYHFLSINGKVERIAALSTLVIYQYSQKEQNGVVVYGLVQSLPSRVDVEFPVLISQQPQGGNCILRLVYDGASFQPYYFCGG